MSRLVKSQFALAAATLTDVFTCPTGRTTAVMLYLCNRGAATTLRISVGLVGAADALKQYIYYDLPFPINNSLKERFPLNEGDVLRVQVGSANVSVNVWPEESQELSQ